MRLEDLPEITFVDADVDVLLENALELVRGILGREIKRADPLMLFVKSLLAIIVQQRLLIDEYAKMNLLAYSKGAALEHLGVLVGVSRLEAAAATCKVEVKLSTAREKATAIRKGTRITAGDGINFELDEGVVFASGESETVISATCQTLGEVGNGYKAGEIHNIVDPQPFLASIMNVTESAGGADVESDAGLRERIHQAPERFSNAGSKGAYEYWAKSASAQVADVYVESESPGEVSVYILEEGGKIPTEELLNKVKSVLSAEEVRPLTDLVHVKPADEVGYAVEVSYWIERSNAITAITIQSRCEEAVESYVQWQKEVLGRDINPSELIYRLKAAGAKRVEVAAPLFLVVPNNAVAVAEGVTLTYGGLEDD